MSLANAAAVPGQAARPSVIAMLSTPCFRTFLQQLNGSLAHGAPLASLDPTALLDRVEGEMRTAELVHNFGFRYPRSCGVDVTIENVPDFPDYYNQWTIQALGGTKF